MRFGLADDIVQSAILSLGLRRPDDDGVNGGFRIPLGTYDIVARDSV